MFKEIIPKIKDKQIILFEEVHGTKEIPKVLSTFLKDVAKDEDFNLCLEIPIEFQNEIDIFIEKGDVNLLKNYHSFLKKIALMEGIV